MVITPFLHQSACSFLSSLSFFFCFVSTENPINVNHRRYYSSFTFIYTFPFSFLLSFSLLFFCTEKPLNAPDQTADAADAPHDPRLQRPRPCIQWGFFPPPFTLKKWHSGTFFSLTLLKAIFHLPLFSKAATRWRGGAWAGSRRGKTTSGRLRKGVKGKRKAKNSSIDSGETERGSGRV